MAGKGRSGGAARRRKGARPSEKKGPGAPASLDELLSSLVRKEVLALRSERLPPERGQYAFTQSLLRSVAYNVHLWALHCPQQLQLAEAVSFTGLDRRTAVHLIQSGVLEEVTLAMSHCRWESRSRLRPSFACSD